MDGELWGRPKGEVTRRVHVNPATSHAHDLLQS